MTRAGPMHTPFAASTRTRDQRILWALLGAVVVCVGGAAAIVYGAFWAPFVAIAAVVVAYFSLRSTRVMLGTIVLLVTVFPFGTLPFRAVITPALIELAIAALLLMRILHGMTTPNYRVDFTSFAPIVFGYISYTLYALFLGARGLPDATTLHNYAKFLLGILLMFAILDAVRDDIDVAWALRLLLVGGGISACVGLLLYLLPATLSEQILVQFGRFGYPTSGRVLRYVEDDTSGLMRAIGFAVDPNSYGGMLAVIGAIAATQTIVEHPILPRRWLIPLSGVVVLVLFLTFSRAALGGLVIAAMYVATVRYRRLWGWIVAAGVLGMILVVFVGIGEQFVTRIVQGVQFQDRANQMRLAEFTNAIAVIQAYPFFGIGFGRAPDIDLVAGVSNIYLAIAQRLGLVGLLIFIGMMAALFARSWRSLRQAVAHNDELHASWLIGLQAGVVAALAVGMLDHYFFNIEFSHMTALLWCTIGLMLAVARNIQPAPTSGGAG